MKHRIWFPTQLARVLQPLRELFRKPQWNNLLQMLLAIMLGHGRTDLSSLTETLRCRKVRRTSIGHFLQKSSWDPALVLKNTAMQMLGWTLTILKNVTHISLIIDSTPWERASLKALGVQKLKLSHHFGHGTIVVAAILRIGNLSIPWALDFCLNKHWAKVLKRKRKTQHQITVEMIESFSPPINVPVFVLFDSFFASREVLNCCRNKDFHFVTNLKRNRKVQAHRRASAVGKWAKNVLNRNGSGITVGKQRFRTAFRETRLPGFGKVYLTFSRKSTRSRIFHLATDLKMTAREMVTLYLERWAIECFFKDVKHHLGFGRYPARHPERACRHMHLIFMAHALLTRMRLSGECTGKIKTTHASSIADVRSILRTQYQAHFLQRTLKRLKSPANFDQILALMREAS